MTLAPLAIVGLTIVFSAFITGVFGMAGGMILISILLICLDEGENRQDERDEQDKDVVKPSC